MQILFAGVANVFGNLNENTLNTIINQAPSFTEKYLSTKYEASVAKGIPMKYLSFFKEFSKKVKPLRIRYRGKSKPGYRRVSSFCHMAYADSFAIYHR